MAKEKDPITPPPGGTLDKCQETKKVVLDFQKECKDKKQNAAQAEADAAAMSLTSYIQTVCDDRRAWKKAEDTRTLYYQLHYNVATGLSGDVAMVQKCVEEQIKASDEIIKSSTTAVGKMKEACSKLLEVCRIAKDWQIAVKQTCSAKSKDELNKILAAKGLTEKDILVKAQNFEETAGIVQNGGDQVIETAVIVTGIYSSVNVSSIKPCAEDLKKYADAFKSDTETNVKSSEEKIKGTVKLLGDDTPKLGEAYFNAKKTASTSAAIKAIVTYLEGGTPVPPPSPSGKTLEEIVKELKKAIPVN